MSIYDEDFTTLTVRPEDALLACVAYSRPEMLALDSIISMHARNALSFDASTSQRTSIAHLPVELLLHIRSHLQATLLTALEDETTAALEEYQSALVEGICADCFWWQSDVYGADVWAWIENGYRGACSCAVVGDIDPRTPSEAKRRVLRKYKGMDIGTRGQWLRAYIQRTYLVKDSTAWRFARGVLTDFGCAHRFERAQGPNVPPLMPTTSEDTAAAFTAPGEPESKKTPRRITSCDFGALVRIGQTPERRQTEEPAITLGRLVRELHLKAPADDEPSIALPSSATRFVDKIHRRTACARHFLAQRGPAGNCADCFALYTAPSFTSYAPRCFSSERPCSLSSLLPATVDFSRNRTLTSIALGAASVVYLVARLAF